MGVLYLPIHLVRLVFLLIHVSSSAPEIPHFLCDRATYGMPKYHSCNALLYGTPVQRGAGIFNIDSIDHGFLLPYFGGSAQFTISQWRHRINLPEVWRNDFCKIALLVRSDPTGGFTTDSGTWVGIARKGKAVLDYCLVQKAVPERGGGVGRAGARNRLDIVMYQEGSLFDRAIGGGVRSDGLVMVDTNGTIVSLSASGRIGNLSHASGGIDLESG